MKSGDTEKICISREQSSKSFAANDPFWGKGLMKNPVEFREWFKILFRVWRPAMSPNQFLVAMFIFDRTAAWGKEWEIITHKHFLEGVRASDGREYASGLVMTKPTLRAALDHLIQCGAVSERKVTRGRTAYALVYEWNPNQQTDMALPKPKRLQTLQPKVTDDSSPEGKEIFPKEGKEIFPQIKENGNAMQKQSQSCGLAAGGDSCNEEDIDDLLGRATQSSRTARSRRLAKWNGDTAAAFWLSECLARFPHASHLAITKTDAAILARYGKRWQSVSKAREVVDLHEYLRWVIRHWLVIREAHFAWMKQASPGVPSIRFMVKFSDRYEGAFEERLAIEQMEQMDSEGREVAKRVRRGMAEEVAKAEVSRKLGYAKEREELQNEKARVNAARLQADAEERQRELDRARADRWRARRPPTPQPGSFDDWE